MTHWSLDAIFYHIYPLGLTGAPERNDFAQPPVARLDRLYDWMPHLKVLGVNALYLGPLFESTAHGYDTADYYHVDRRLGTDETLAKLSAALHTNGMRLVLDAVFNHVGRDFWAFRDVQSRGLDSPYRDWFHNLRFDGRSPYGDPFTYESWAGHYDLVKLNLGNPAVREHLFGAVASWMDAFAIDGLRLDAADVIDPDFLKALAAFCKGRRPDFWLMGEIVQGDYRRLVNPQMLDSATNYECYKGLYSSLEAANYFEIAYALNRQFGETGLYRNVPLYNFADNHDVNRVASNLKKAAHLYPLHSPSLAPAGKYAVTIYTVAPDTLAEGSWSERKEELADKLLAEAEAHIPGLREHTQTRLILTPEDYRKRTHLKHHSFGGVPPVMSNKPPAHKTPVHNLWFIGAQSESTGGVQNVMTGAAKVAKRILKGEK